MKRFLAAILFLSVVAAGIYGVNATRRERNYRRLVDAGEAALERGDTSAALAAFSGAIELKQDSMLGYLKRGETHRLRNELEAALPDLRRAAELDPLAPRPLELLGDVNFALRRFSRAAEHYQGCVRLDDRSGHVLYKLGLAHYTAGQAAQAVAALLKAVKVDADLAEGYYLLGLCYRSLQKPHDAVAALVQSVKLAPTLLQAREELGDLYGELGRQDERVTQLEALRGLDPGPSREVTLGLAYARAGQAQSALVTLGIASERYPDYPSSHVALGRLWLERAQSTGDRVDLSKALEALESAVASDGGSEALTLYGRALLLARSDVDAEQMLQRAIEKPPVDPLAFYYLAQAAERRVHPALALRALLDYHALEGDPPDARAANALALRVADLSMRTGDASTAMAWYERAIGQTDNDVAVLLRLADAQTQAGATDAARVTVTRVLEKDPANLAAQNLYRRLQ